MAVYCERILSNELDIPGFKEGLSIRVPGLKEGRLILAKWYDCDPSEMTVRKTDSKNAADWQAFGTNASFFWRDAKIMTAVHVADNKVVYKGGKYNCAAAKESGEELGDKKTAMDLFCCIVPTATVWVGDGTITMPRNPYYGPPADPRIVKVFHKVHAWIPIVPNYVSWAIGGFDLFVDTYYADEKMLVDRINANFNVEPNPHKNMISWVPRYKEELARTAIGIMPNGKIRFGAFYGSDSKGNATVSGGPTVHEMHQIMHALGCAKALLLDGSGSTKIKYLKDGEEKSENGDGREVYCMLALTDDAAENCNWDG